MESKPKAKIIIFSTAYHPFIGGAEIAVQEVMKRLADRFDFYVITARFSRRLARKEVIGGAVVLRVGWGCRLDKFLLPLLGPLAVRRNIQLSRKADPKIIFWGIMVSYGSVGASFLKWLYPQIPFLITLQEGDSPEHLLRGKLGFISFWWRVVLAQADAVSAISSYLAHFAKKQRYEGEPLIIPNGVDITSFSRPDSFTKKNRGKKIIITTSRLVEKNGIDILIEAFSKVHQQMPNTECWIIGDGPLKDELMAKAGLLGVKKQVKFFGRIAHKEIPKYLWQADLFVRPSRSEGMGNSFVEALAAGVPIIGTPVGGILDIIKDGKTGFFAAPENAEDLSQKIIYALSHQDLSRQTVLEGKRMVRGIFSWDCISQKYAQLLQKLNQSLPLKIVIATPIVFQIGGPALYAKNLADHFRKFGNRTSIVSFEKFSKLLPSGLSQFLFLVYLLKKCRRADVLFCLDPVSVGVPAVVCSKIRKIPIVLRMEGDFLWESFLQRTRQDIPLADFYRKMPLLSFKEKLILKSLKFTLNNSSRIAFSSKWRQNMIKDFFSLPDQKLALITNVFPTKSVSNKGKSISKIILWAGRMSYLKNLYRLIDAFSLIKRDSYKLLLIGDGPEKKRLQNYVAKKGLEKYVLFCQPVSHRDLMGLIKRSAFVVLPSLSEVGPNIISEAVSLGKSFILTFHTGYREYLRELGLWVDPLRIDDLSEKLRLFLEKNKYTEYEKRIQQAGIIGKDWKDAAQEWIKLFEEVK